MDRVVKPLKYKSLEGLSEKQLQEHHDVLYAGYVKKYNEIVDSLKDVDMAGANATYSALRELQLEKGFALNGIKLHEDYFDNLRPEASGLPIGRIVELIARDFGSVEKWADQFAALGIASRGWVVLGYDLETKRLDNYICDMHNQGGVWNTISLVVLDVYEHAYFLDYATARKAYIETFMRHIDWQEVNKRLNRYNIN